MGDPDYWNHDFKVDEQNLVENLQARRIGHVDPVLVIITDATITGGDMLYYGLSLSEVLAGGIYPLEPAPSELSAYSPLYIFGDILGNTSRPAVGGAVSSVYADEHNATWYWVYYNTAKTGDRWIIETFIGGAEPYSEANLPLTFERRIAHADPHTVVVNDSMTNTGEFGWYRLSLAEVKAGKSYDHMGNWHFNTGDIVGNGPPGPGTSSGTRPSPTRRLRTTPSTRSWTAPMAGRSRPTSAPGSRSR